MTKTSLHGLLSAIEKHYLWAETPSVLDAAQSIPEFSFMKARLCALRATAGKLAADYATLPNQLRETLDEGFRLDSFYDRKLAGLCQMLSALSTTTDNRYLADTLRTMKATLFPEGVLGETESYLRQTGYVVVSDMRITLEMRETLKGIVYNGCSLLDDYTEWVVLGKRLSQVESKWEHLVAKHNADAMSPTELRNMRIKWRVLLDEMCTAIKDCDLLADGIRMALLDGIRAVEEIYRVDENVFQLRLEDYLRARTG